jgi:REP element-mobilizing transposase RayT
MDIPFDADVHHRRSIRLDDYDYRQGGAYFVTLCVHRHGCLLGEVMGGEMRLNTLGEIVEREWQRTPSLRPQIELDMYVIMPNHFHAIFIMNDLPQGSVGAYCNTPLQKPPASSSLQSPSQTVGAIVRGFKAATTKQVNILRKTPGLPFWQRNYWEHIDRNERDLARLRDYIERNPGKWEEDKYHPSKNTE